MSARKAFDALYFNDDRVLDNQIGAIFADQATSIDDGYSQLTIERKPSFGELDSEGFFTRVLRQPRSQFPMHRNRAADDALGQFLVKVH